MTKKKGEMYNLPTRHWHYYREDPNREEHEYFKHQQKYKPCVSHTSFEFKFKSRIRCCNLSMCVPRNTRFSCVFVNALNATTFCRSSSAFEICSNFSKE